MEVIKGYDKLIRKLAKLKRTDAKKAIRKGTRQGAKVVAALAKQLAPVKTGNLRRGIKVRSLKSRKYIGATVRIGVAGTPTFYATFVDLGTHGRYTKALGYRGKIKGRRFMKLAAQQAKAQATDTALTTIKKEVEIALQR